MACPESPLKSRVAPPDGTTMCSVHSDVAPFYDINLTLPYLTLGITYKPFDLPYRPLRGNDRTTFPSKNPHLKKNTCELLLVTYVVLKKILYESDLEREGC